MLSKLKFLVSQPGLALRDRLTSDSPLSPPAGEFVKGINLGGEAVVIDGNPWLSYSEALATGLSAPGVTVAQTYRIPKPHAQGEMRAMLNTVIFKTQTLALEQSLPNGRYDLYLWIMENFQTNWHSLELQVASQPIAQGLGQLSLDGWARYGPYTVAVNEGWLNLALTTHSPEIDAHLMGLSLHRVD
jgi:hypothetical protein